MTTQPNSNRTSSSGKRKPSKKTIVPIRLMSAIIIVLMLLLASLIFLTRKPPEKVAAEIDDGTFYEGISVNGISLFDKSLAEGKELVSSSAEKKLLAANLSLHYKDKTWTIQAKDIGAKTDLEDVLRSAMAFGRDGSAVQNVGVRSKAKEEGKNFETSVTVDETALRTKLQNIAAEIDMEPTEPIAEYHPESEEPLTYKEGLEGLKVDVETALADCLNRIKENNSSALDLTVMTIPSTVTIEEVKNRTKMIATFTTSFATPASLSKAGRVKNITKGAELISGLILQPAEQFSFNEHVGPRSEDKGWSLAMSIVNGNNYEESFGGGICQVSTTLYNALLRAGLDFSAMTRKHHSFPSSYVPIGLDATVSDGGPDFVFTNTREHPIYVFMIVDKEKKTLTATVYGPELPDGITLDLHSKVTKEIEPQEPEIIEDETQPIGFSRTLIEPRKGQVAEIYLDKLDKDGKVISSELLYTDTYKAVRAVQSVGTGTGTVEIPEE